MGVTNAMYGQFPTFPNPQIGPGRKRFVRMPDLAISNRETYLADLVGPLYLAEATG
jgi:hypothetical protein